MVNVPSYDIFISKKTCIPPTLIIILYTLEQLTTICCGEMANNSSQSNEVCFLTNAEFDYMVQTKHEAEEAIGWKILPKNTVYRVEKMTPIHLKWGSRCILLLRDTMGQEINVWAPSNVVRDLKSSFKLNGKDCTAFIKSLGEKKTNVAGKAKKKFFDFETVYIPM